MPFAPSAHVFECQFDTERIACREGPGFVHQNDGLPGIGCVHEELLVSFNDSIALQVEDNKVSLLRTSTAANLFIRVGDGRARDFLNGSGGHGFGATLLGSDFQSRFNLFAHDAKGQKTEPGETAGESKAACEGRRDGIG